MESMVKVQVHTPTRMPMMRIIDTAHEARVLECPTHEVVEVPEAEAARMLEPSLEGGPDQRATDIRILRAGLL